MKSTALEGFDG